MPSRDLNSPPVAERRRARPARILRLASTLTTLADHQPIVNFCNLLVSTPSGAARRLSTDCQFCVAAIVNAARAANPDWTFRAIPRCFLRRAQAPKYKQAPNPKRAFGIWSLSIKSCLKFEIWVLGFVIK
jgi:hypothetical protein